MDKNDVLEIVVKFGNMISQKYDLISIYLFGSFANGNNKEYSDIDIAIVLKDYDDYFKTQMDLMRLRRSIDTRIEPHPFRLSEFNALNPFAKEILNHGIDINIYQQTSPLNLIAEDETHYLTPNK